MTNDVLANVDRLNAVFEEHDLDVIVACSGRHTAYLSGVHQPPSRFTTYYQDNADSPRRFFVIWPRDGDPTLITQKSSEEFARNQSWISDIRSYKEWIESPYQLAVDNLKERGLDQGRIGVERRELGTERWESITRQLGSADFVECTDILTQVRNVKTPKELEIMEKADRILDEAYRRVYTNAKPSDTLRHLESEMSDAMLDQGADASFGWFHIKDTPFSRASDYPDPISKGDIIRADHVCYYKGYTANISRHAIVGEPDDAVEETYRTFRDIHRDTIEEMFYPGVKGKEVYEYLKERALEEGFSEPRTLAGHGIGVWSVHERPIFHEEEDWEIRSGMVIVMEPILNNFWQLQDQIYITDDGPEWMSDKSNSDELYIIG